MCDVDPKKIIDYKFDPRTMIKTNSLLKEATLIEKINDETSVYYIKCSIPILSDRDGVMQIMIKDLQNDSWYFGVSSVNSE